MEVDTMEENGIGIIENERINRLIHNTFISTYENVPVDEKYENIYDVPLIEKEKNPYTKTQI